MRYESIKAGIMKKICFILLVLFTFSNCEKEEPFLFSMDYERNFEIPAGLNIFSPWDFQLNNIPTSKVAFLSANNATEEDVTEITPRSARITSLIASEDFSFIRDISVRMYKNDVSDYQEIFYRDNIPLNTSGNLSLIPTLVNVEKKLFDEEFNVVIKMEFRDSPPQYTEVVLDLEFAVR